MFVDENSAVNRLFNRVDTLVTSSLGFALLVFTLIPNFFDILKGFFGSR